MRGGGQREHGCVSKGDVMPGNQNGTRNVDSINVRIQMYISLTIAISIIYNAYCQIIYITLTVR